MPRQFEFIRVKQLSSDNKGLKRWSVQLVMDMGVMQFINRPDALPHTTALRTAKSLARRLGDIEIREDAW